MDQNRRLYERHSVATRYARRAELQAAETALFERYRGDIAGRRILDVGVGSGRTTPFLLELSSDYIGVDYSRTMIEQCRGRFPQASLQVADARDLSCFPDRSFDFVLFSHSGIDAIDHQGRLSVFSEVHRVLSTGALFLFSSHNRNFAIPRPWSAQHLDVNALRHPVRFGRRIGAIAVGMVNYARHARCTEMHDEFCISIDSAFRYGLIHYRIAPRAQKRQLECAGFDRIVPFDLEGRSLAWSEAELRSGEPWFYYACRKA